MEEQAVTSITCDMCGKTTTDSEDDIAMLGQWMKHKELTVHYFCLLLATNLPQRGSDNAGIMGFLLRDIRKEVAAARKRICRYCAEPGATIECHKCGKYFDLVCSVENRCTPQFCGDFPTFCDECPPMDEYKQHLVKHPPNGVTCDICMNQIVLFGLHHVVYPECCRLGFVHKMCMRRYAASSGYYLTCIWCRSVAFRDTIRRQGIFVPDRDAKWELQRNAYRELHVRTLRCDEKECLCAKGRAFNSKAWEIIACQLCGAAGAHTKCLSGSVHLLKGAQRIEFKCTACQEVENKMAASAEQQPLSIPSEPPKVADSLLLVTKEGPQRPAAAVPAYSEGPSFSDDGDSFADASNITVVPAQRQSSANSFTILSVISIVPPRQAEVVDLMASQAESVHPTDSHAEVIDLMSSQEESVDPMASQAQIVEPMATQAEVVEPMATQEEFVEPMDSLAQVVELKDSHPNVVDPLDFQSDVAVPFDSQAEVVELKDTQTEIMEFLETQSLPGQDGLMVLRECFNIVDEPFFYLVVYEFDPKGTCKGSCTYRFDDDDPRVLDRSEEALKRVEVCPGDVWFRNKDCGIYGLIDAELEKFKNTCSL